MKYTSTRDASIKIDASNAILSGISKDGGLFVPDDFPNIDNKFLEKLSKFDYRERAYEILRLFLNDFSDEKIKEIVNLSYSDNFDTENPAPLHKLNDNLYVEELWHGPTCAFKDMALQILPYLLRESAVKNSPDKQIVILVATSGDTGKAALEGFKNVKNTKIMVFFPEDGVSNIQKLQMVSSEGDNVYVCALKGNFDDAQTSVKKIFTDAEIISRLSENNMDFSSANSINWGRLVPQIVYYISAYCDLVREGRITAGEYINFTVPTGNFGNILAAYYAKKTGLPIKHLICASNSNNVLTDFIKDGTYDKNRKFFTTISPSMDILVSSNLERLLFDLSDNDANYVSILMEGLKKEGKYTVNDKIKNDMQKIFFGYCCDDEKTKKTIAKTFDEYGYLIDTHTAVAVNAYDKYLSETNDKTVSVIVSTASPYKFSDSVLSSLKSVESENDFDIIEEMSDYTNTKMPVPFEKLKTAKVIHKDLCLPEEMPDYVISKLCIK